MDSEEYSDNSEDQSIEECDVQTEPECECTNLDPTVGGPNEVAKVPKPPSYLDQDFDEDEFCTEVPKTSTRDFTPSF